MKQIDDKDKLIALAHLHQGKKPKEVAETIDSISYAQALRLKKELDKAVEDETLSDLFNLSQTALNSLLDTVKEELSDATEALTGDVISVDKEIDGIKDKIQGQKLLEVELSKTGVAIAKKLKYQAENTNNPESLLMLADALAKLQTSFFKNSSVQIANFEGQLSEFTQK